MSLSNLCFEQHERDQARLRKLLLWGLLGSVGMHVVAFGLSYLNLWPKAHEAELSPIELIVMEPPTDPVEEPEEQLPVEPAELSTETNAPTPAPVAQAPATRAAVVTAPPPTPVAPPEPVDVVEPEPIPETEVESELEVPEDPEVEPEPIPETEVESELEVPEDPEVEPEAEAPEAQLPPEEIEDTEAEADPAESNLATAAEDSSQLDRLHDFFQSQREAATEAPSPGNTERGRTVLRTCRFGRGRNHSRPSR